MFAFNQPARLIHRQTTTTLALLALVVGIASNCAGQEESVQSDPEIVKQLHAALDHAVDTVAVQSAYTVTIERNWQTTGETASQGNNTVVLKRIKNGPYRLNVHSEVTPGQRQVFQCIGDGKTNHLLLESNLGTLTSELGGGTEIPFHDVFTETNLRFSGLSMLLDHNAADRVMGRAYQIESLGTEKINGSQAQGFRMKWGDGGQIEREMWITVGDQPVLVRLQTRIQVNAKPQQETLCITANLAWDFDVKFDRQEFQVAEPKDSIAVADLYSYLAQGMAREQLLKPVPEFKLTTAGGEEWSPMKHAGKPQVLFFFNSSSQACRYEIQPLIELLQQQQKAGLACVGIGVGEDNQHCARFQQETAFPFPVLSDAGLQATRALKVSALPAIVVIDGKGIVLNCVAGNTEQSRDFLDEEFAQLFKQQTGQASAQEQ